MKRSLLVFLSPPLVFYGIFSLQAEVVGKSIATVNGEAIGYQNLKIISIHSLSNKKDDFGRPY